MSSASALIGAILDAAARAGVDVDALLAAAGLDRARLDDPTARVDAETCDRLQLLALEWTGDPAFGLHAGERAGARDLDRLGDLSGPSDTVGAHIDAWLRPSLIGADGRQPRRVNDGSTVRLVHLIPRSTPARERLRAELEMTRLLERGRLLTGGLVGVREVWFEHEAPEYEREYDRIFEGKQRFGMPETAVVFDGELLERGARSFGIEPCEPFQARIEPSLRSVVEEPTFTERVHALVCAQSLGTRPSAAEVARALRLTERSLRRRLEAEATSFTAVMDDARSEVARRVLAEASITIKEAGFRMGFSDVSAFHRAFKRWTGMTPAEYQRGLAEVRALDESAGVASASEAFPEPISEIRALRPVPALEHG